MKLASAVAQTSPKVLGQNSLTISFLLVKASTTMDQFGLEPTMAIRERIKNIKQGKRATLSAACVVAFDMTPWSVQELQMVENIETENIHYTNCGHDTRLYEAVRGALIYLIKIDDTRQERGLAPLRVEFTLLSDGEDTQSKPSKLDSCRVYTAEARKRDWGLAIHGFGSNADTAARLMGFMGPDDPAWHVHAPSVEILRVSRRAAAMKNRTDATRSGRMIAQP